MPGARFHDNTPEVRLILCTKTGQLVPRAFPRFPAVGPPHGASELVELPQHHQIGDSRRQSARPAAAILHQAETAIGQLDRQRPGLRPTG